MAEATLQDVFGAGATQTSTTITILKSQLPFTATATNNGEQVLSAIVKKAAPIFTQTIFDTDITKNISIAQGYDSLVYRTNGANQDTLLQVPFTINFCQTQASGGINPDLY
jgi:hypothetical protein